MEFNLYPWLAKIILYFNPFRSWRVMCLGYGDDFEQFTELVWSDDKYLNLYDKKSYPKIQLWNIGSRAE